MRDPDASDHKVRSWSGSTRVSECLLGMLACSLYKSIAHGVTDTCISSPGSITTQKSEDIGL